MVLKAIKYSRGSLKILDQLRLPHVEVYDDVESCKDAWHAIKEMRVRGAPAIAIVAALALAVEIYTIQAEDKLSSSAEDVQVFIAEKLEYLVTSRPTAVNLADAARKLGRVVESAAQSQGTTGGRVADTYIKAAEQMLVDDVRDNQSIGKYGAEWILKNAERGKQGSKVSVLTHCNTGLAHGTPSKRPQPSDLTRL
jgi:methylthioribose-1-phosphate isomerase